MLTRRFALTNLIALVIAIGAAGCGSVPAPKADASGGSDGEVEIDASTGGCTANAYSCGADDALFQCDEEGNAETKVEDCQYGCAGDACKECEASSMFCSADDLVSCDANGKITNPQTCANGCQMDRCNTCKPNVAFCSNGNAVACLADGTAGATTNCGAAGCANGVCNSCTPNTTSCVGDKLVVCNANGAIQTATDCALGCSTAGGAHCKVMAPSYGVGIPSGNLPNLDVTANATLNISNCPASADLTIGTTMTVINGSPQLAQVAQSGGPPICVVRFGSITVNSGFTLTIVNNASPGHVVSLQAVGDIQVAGTISFVSNANGPSPGGTVNAINKNANNDHYGPGGGGAGAARAGGAGGKYSTTSGGAGGAAVTTIATRLTAGSKGGNVMSGETVVGTGGRGGGGLQIVSLTKVTVAATGRIAVNGAGGSGGGVKVLLSGNFPAGGGGSGGTLVVEAPAISMSAGAVAAANGGGGAGGCYTCDSFRCTHVNGQSGQLSANRAAGGDCTDTGGDGGWEANGATLPSILGSNWSTTAGAGGGGGGSNGFIFLRAKTAAQVSVNGSAVVSPPTTPGAVTAN
jgi:hypothetical protein